MKEYIVNLILLQQGQNIAVKVQANNAIQACDVAQALNPNTVASGADIITA